MNQFVLQQGNSKQLGTFPHILQFGLKKNNSTQLGFFPVKSTNYLSIYYIIDGKFEWVIDGQHHNLYPGNAVIVLPNQSFGSKKGDLEIGTYSWIHLAIQTTKSGQILTGNWSNLLDTERGAIGKILQLNKQPILLKSQELGGILKNLQVEIFEQHIGFHTAVNNLLDELLIRITRCLTQQNNSGRDFPKSFTNLEKSLRENLSHQWTVEQMAAMVGLGTTLFNDKFKSYSGFSPIHYLINIRITEGIKLLKQRNTNLTDIALDIGFYSSQHFSTTFKKLTGYTPSEFRKNHLPENHEP